jgi:hypothetical protein
VLTYQVTLNDSGSAAQAMRPTCDCEIIHV